MAKTTAMAASRIAYAASLALFALSVGLNIATRLRLGSPELFATTSFFFSVGVLALILQAFPLLVETFSDEDILALRPALARRVSLTAFDKIRAITNASLRDAPIWSKGLYYALVIYMFVICLITFIGPRPLGAIFVSAIYASVCWTYVIALAFTLHRLRGTRDPQAGAVGRL